MPLLKIKDFDPDYKEAFGGYDIKGLDVYSEVNGEKIGTVSDLLIDEQGRFRYFIIDLGFWGFGKKVLLPVGRSQIDSEGKHIHALGFTKDQAENLPEFSESLKIDNDYEDRVRGSYQSQRPIPTTPVPPAGAPENISTAGQVPPVSPPSTSYSAPAPPAAPRPQDYPQNYSGYGQTAPPSAPSPQPAQSPASSSQPSVQSSRPMQSPQPVQQPANPSHTAPDAPSYDYQQEPSLYELNEQHHSVLRRFEQRLQEKRMSGRR